MMQKKTQTLEIRFSMRMNKIIRIHEFIEKCHEKHESILMHNLIVREYSPSNFCGRFHKGINNQGNI